VEVHEGIPRHLPPHLRERFEGDEGECSTLRCEASEVASITAEIVKVAAWWESRPETRYRFRAARAFEAVFLRDTLEEVGVEVAPWLAIGTAEGGVEVEFRSDAPIDALRSVMRSAPGGDRMSETLVPLDTYRGERETQAPAPKGEA
jgi:hypothetical protein